ncbi:dihydrofolate reductase family protein [Oscillibacter sp.]|uniref:dihydrofolate reductase family protein n=1 Tax=Oscillibacter sp. TaxID=1945593 RepID=UPI0028A687D1|nr:dihydrofolate reductase family protein [Oscillibacter sp.]
MKKVVLYIAMSLDGYIADKAGGVEWLSGDGSDPENTGSYDEFIKTIDTVILGYNSYHQIVTELSPNQWVYSGLKSYVITHKTKRATDEIIYTDRGISELINNLKIENGKDIWICGGASIVNQCISLDLIDKYHIAIIPTILGGGIKLFEDQDVERKLQLIFTHSYNGINELVYERRL